MSTGNKSGRSGRKRKATTPEARENQLISLAMDRAEEQLVNGTASSQLIVHFLKLGSTRDALEKEMLAKKTELVTAQVENLESQKKTEALYEEALIAMRKYNGQTVDEG